MYGNIREELKQKLEDISNSGLYKTERHITSPQKARISVAEKEVLNMCANNYLGLADNSEIIAAVKKGLDSRGFGMASVRFICGTQDLHHELEQKISDFFGTDDTILYTSCFDANTGLFETLLDENDAIISDALNHASIIDGVRLCKAGRYRYAHGDMGALANCLLDASDAKTRMIATDGVFSMDGDIAPLPALAQTAEAHAAWLLVDDAHGLGVVGPQGRGSLAACGLGINQVPILVGTLGKAFGTFGAFVAGSDDLIETLIQEARTWIYTTAPPPAIAVATLAALRLVESEDWRRAHLQALVRHFRAGAARLGLNLCDSATPIQPVIAGTAEVALRWSAALRDAGILITAIRPPTVPAGTSRLRITFSAAHTEAHVDRLLDMLEQTLADTNHAEHD